MLIGYVCSTLSSDDSLTHASMSTHVSGAPSVCIHSVCVSPDHRRKHIGLNLVSEYISRLEKSGLYRRILLIAHEDLRAFYEKAGFEWIGPSAVVHGARPWYELRRDLASVPGQHELQPALISGPQASQESQTQGVPAGLWEALQRASTRTRPVPRLLPSFPKAVEDVVNAPSSSAGSPTNKYDLLCPRLGCGSIILKNGVAHWVERASVQLEPAESTLPSSLGVLPDPPATAQWWLITGNAMVFENIGFSRSVPGLAGT